VVIVVVALASSSYLFFPFIVVITLPPHNTIPSLPPAPWPDTAVVVKSVHDDYTKNTIFAKVQ
jgi:hypothetical protein